MSWDLTEATDYYKSQGAPRDQAALTNLLKEVQRENGGAIPKAVLPVIGDALGVRESFLLAVIRRIPSLRLQDKHVLEVCSGAVCGKRGALAAFAETLRGEKLEVRFVPCMRLCGKGPNVKWDGRLYSGADTALLKRLASGEEFPSDP